MIAVVLTDKHYFDLKQGRETLVSFSQPALDSHKELFVKRYYFDSNTEGVAAVVEPYLKCEYSVTYILRPKEKVEVEQPYWVRDVIRQGGVV